MSEFVTGALIVIGIVALPLLLTTIYLIFDPSGE